ncbi:MAG: pentapeptide repeat-containing protein [Phycisphaeraceae bacterium]|nr:pentapeptide repeat-containing protein [Phycisphaerales bacterium]MCB9859673.1 pentapeptide repeat-containing protein [Phycisphaeraceae bacterium]
MSKPPIPPKRPEDHPNDEGFVWPPIFPSYPKDSPARSNKESTVAFNHEAAVQAFGNEFIKNKVSSAKFKGDVWMLAMLKRCDESARKTDPHGKDPQRFVWWNEKVVAKAKKEKIVIHLEGLGGNNAHFSHISLNGALLTGSELGRSDLRNSSIASADLRSVVLLNADLTGADLSHTFLQNVNLDSANIHGTSFIDSVGLFGKDRATDNGNINFANAQNAIYCKDGDFASWETLRIITGLRLVGASYLSVVAIITYITLARQYNDLVAAASNSALRLGEPDSGIATLWCSMLSNVPKLPIPWHFGLQLIAAFLVAVSATIYAKYCPSEVKEATEVRWTRTMGQPLWEYRAAAWSNRKARHICFLFFVGGASYTLVYITLRAITVLWYVFAG